jgi:hypothetical protein
MNLSINDTWQIIILRYIKSSKFMFCYIQYYLYKKRNNLLNKIMNIKEKISLLKLSFI